MSVEEKFNILKEEEKSIKAYIKKSDEVVNDIGKTIFKENF